MITQKDIIYFIFTDRFYNGDKQNDYNVNPDDPRGWHGGDFAGIIKKIPYLKELGITALWITPVYQNIEDTKNPDFRNQAYHGYWPLDFDKVDRHLYSHSDDIPDGSKQHLRKLSDELKNHGIKLIVDMVINHTGYEHPWTEERPDWYHEEDDGSDVKKELYGLPDLDLSNPDVIDYFIQNINDWINVARVDGIRMDAVKHIDKPFWYHLKASFRGACPGVTIFGESFDYDPSSVSVYQNYVDFDSMLDFPLKNAMHEVFVDGQSFFKIARPRIGQSEQSGVLDKDFHYNNPYRLITFINNHDMPRVYTSLLERFGKDPDGKRLAKEVFKMIYTFLLTCRGIPQLYYGDEIAMEGGSDPDNRRDMPWELFSGNKPMKKHELQNEIFEYMKNLIRLRKLNSALQHGSLMTLWVDHFVMVYLRYFKDNIVICAFNNGEYPMSSPLEIPFGENTNIPTRIRNITNDKTRVYSELNNQNFLQFNHKTFTVQLKGKEGDIFIVNR